MNKYRQALVVALRSGDYKQTPHRLRRHDEFCCLGVACDRSGLGEWKQSGHEWFYVIDGTWESHCLPPQVQKQLGFADSAGGYTTNPDGQSLANDNDAGHTFDDIAATIESEPQGLLAEEA